MLVLYGFLVALDEVYDDTCLWIFLILVEEEVDVAIQLVLVPARLGDVVGDALWTPPVRQDPHFILQTQPA